MYRSLYNLKSRPFELEPDPLFLWLGERHKETLFFLRYGILDNMGFLLLAGGAGTGKTALINGLARGLKSDVEWAIISKSSHESLEFYNEIVTGFGLDAVFTSKVEFFIQFSHFLHKAYEENKKVVLFVDDCHLLSQEILDELRLLPNIQKGDAKLIDIFFVGQPEFAEMLAVPCNHSIQEQLALKAKLVPFSVNETGHYILHRLKVSGATSEIFTSRAVQQIHTYSQGIAREINIICERALQAGAALGEKIIDEKLIVMCVEEPDKLVEDDLRRDASTSEQGKSDFSGEVDDRVTPEVIEGKKRGSLLPYVMLFAVCIGLGFYFFSAKRDMFSVPDRATDGVMQETAIVAGPGIVDSGETDPRIAVAIIEPEPLKGSMEMAKSEVLVAQVEESVEGVTVPPVTLGELDGPAGKRVVEEPAAEVTVPEESVVEEMAVADATAGEAPAMEMGTVAELTENEAVDEVEDSEKAVGQAAAEEIKVPEETAGELLAEEVEVPENPPQAPLQPDKVLLGLQPNTLKLTREANKNFSKFVETLLQYPNARVLVKGYVSSNNDTSENLKLSEKRAATVRQLLIKHGVAAIQIEVRGMGIQDPIATNDTRAGRLKNRRVEIVVIDDGV